MNLTSTIHSKTQACRSGFSLRTCALIAVAILSVVSSDSYAQSVAFTGATIETMGEAGRLENATIVVSDGKITEVGTDVEIPDDARVVSMSGKTIMPGIVCLLYTSPSPRDS